MGSARTNRRSKRRARSPGVVRLGLSLEPELLAKLDGWVKLRNSPSRSDGIRFLIRKEMAEEALGDPASDAVGTVTLLYRHDAPGVLGRLTGAQHRWGGHVRSTTHVHLRAGACVEIIVLEGRRAEVERAAQEIRGVRGVLQGGYRIVSPEVAGATTGHRHPHDE
jgi:CopG family transcriptional regulator, nickel-responsive regulator